MMLCVAGAAVSMPSTRAETSPESAAAPLVARGRYLMGTVFRFEAPAFEDPAGTARALDRALDEVERLESILSNWGEDSELSKANRSAWAGPVRVSPELFQAVQAAIHWAGQSRGAFDPTVQSLARPLFRAESVRAGVPIETTGEKPTTGWRCVKLDPGERTIHLPGAVDGIDLGGIGKGYALDRAGQILRADGIGAALLDAGGQLLAMGTPPGERGWTVAVADPSRRERAALPLLLRNVSIATSGNAERPGEIVDPGTGKPILGEWSATAVASEATSADAFSTALFVMGPSRGVNWARERDDVVALFLLPSGEPGVPAELRASRELTVGEGGIVEIASGLGAFKGGIHAN